MHPALTNNATKDLSTGACQSSQPSIHADRGHPSCSPPNNTRAAFEKEFSTHTLQTHNQLPMTATTPAAPTACCKGPMLNVHKSCSQKEPRQTLNKTAGAARAGSERKKSKTQRSVQRQSSVQQRQERQPSRFPHTASRQEITQQLQVHSDKHSGKLRNFPARRSCCRYCPQHQLRTSSA